MILPRGESLMIICGRGLGRTAEKDRGGRDGENMRTDCVA